MLRASDRAPSGAGAIVSRLERVTMRARQTEGRGDAGPLAHALREALKRLPMTLGTILLMHGPEWTTFLAVLDRIARKPGRRGPGRGSKDARRMALQDSVVWALRERALAPLVQMVH